MMMLVWVRTWAFTHLKTCADKEILLLEPESLPFWS